MTSGGGVGLEQGLCSCDSPDSGAEEMVRRSTALGSKPAHQQSQHACTMQICTSDVHTWLGAHNLTTPRANSAQRLCLRPA